MIAEAESKERELVLQRSTVAMPRAVPESQASLRGVRKVPNLPRRPKALMPQRAVMRLQSSSGLPNPSTSSALAPIGRILEAFKCLRGYAMATVLFEK